MTIYHKILACVALAAPTAAAAQTDEPVPADHRTAIPRYGAAARHWGFSRGGRGFTYSERDQIFPLLGSSAAPNLFIGLRASSDPILIVFRPRPPRISGSLRIRRTLWHAVNDPLPDDETEAVRNRKRPFNFATDNDVDDLQVPDWVPFAHSPRDRAFPLWGMPYLDRLYLAWRGNDGPALLLWTPLQRPYRPYRRPKIWVFLGASPWRDVYSEMEAIPCH